jgi:hypothetical protein
MRFVYGANRLHDTITWFSIAADGTLRFVREEPMRGDYPRFFTFDPYGRFVPLYPARTYDRVVRVDRKTGALIDTGPYTPVDRHTSRRFSWSGRTELRRAKVCGSDRHGKAWARRSGGVKRRSPKSQVRWPFLISWTGTLQEEILIELSPSGRSAQDVPDRWLAGRLATGAQRWSTTARSRRPFRDK